MTYDNSPPTASDLDALTADLNYEIGMVWYLARIAIPQSTIEPDRNAYKEALLIHTRCLMEFFNCQARHDDVVATDYYPDWDPVKDGGAELDWLNEHLVMFINKRVAHLTAYRQRVPKEDYFIETVQRHVQTLVERFLAEVTDDLRKRIRGLTGQRTHGSE